MPRSPAGSSISRGRCLASPCFDSQLNRFYVFTKDLDLDLDLEFSEKKEDSNLPHIRVNTMKPVLTPKTTVTWHFFLSLNSDRVKVFIVSLKKNLVPRLFLILFVFNVYLSFSTFSS